MGLFSKKPRGMTPAEEAARRRGAHIPDAREAHTPSPTVVPRPNVAGPAYETKTLKLSQLDFVHGRTNVEQKLEPYIADGWEVVSQDIKKYNVGGKHTVLLRRLRTS